MGEFVADENPNFDEIAGHHSALRSVLRSLPKQVEECPGVWRADPRLHDALWTLADLSVELNALLTATIEGLPERAASPLGATPGFS
jgi:hypothetical protein